MIPDWELGGKLLFDREHREGEVSVKVKFIGFDTAFQLDAVKDWIKQLNEMYNDLVKEWESESSTGEGEDSTASPGKLDKAAPPK